VNRPLALDLFCGAGGASMGLYRAGLDVIGVDIRPQPRYPFRFIRGDALRPPVDLGRFDFVWASPPCQHFSLATRCRPGAAEKHPNLIPPIRNMLERSSGLFCMENVPGAPLRHDLVLTGCMFGLTTYRKRKFEMNYFVLAPRPGVPFGPESRPGTFTIVGHTGNSSLKTRKAGVNRGTKTDWQRAIGIDWMSVAEMANAVPPAYSEFIGRAALQYMKSAA
jgi:DNA (cytosine-5)-methyltransferase 1